MYYCIVPLRSHQENWLTVFPHDLEEYFLELLLSEKNKRHNSKHPKNPHRILELAPAHVCVSVTRHHIVEGKHAGLTQVGFSGSKRGGKPMCGTCADLNQKKKRKTKTKTKTKKKTFKKLVNNYLWSISSNKICICMNIHKETKWKLNL